MNTEDPQTRILVLFADGTDSHRKGKIDLGFLPLDLTPFDLAPDTSGIDGLDESLRTLVQVLVEGDLTRIREIFGADERGLVDLGRYLFDQVLGQVSQGTKYREVRRKGDVELRLVTRDEHLLRLPWYLIADREGFLRWPTLLARDRELEPCELPERPRLLVAVPDPRQDTLAEDHLADLLHALSAEGTSDYPQECVTSVRTWQEFRDEYDRTGPHLLYFYGHGLGSLRASTLLFQGEDGGSEEVPVTKLAEFIKENRHPAPRLAYLNCCYGDAGGILGAGVQLRLEIPAVVSNRTLADQAATQDLGVVFWRRLLVDGAAPHEAAASALGELRDRARGVNPRWMAPVLHGSYSDWQATPLRRTRPPKGPGEPFMGFGREKHLERARKQARLLLTKKPPRCLGLLWYGRQEQGVDHFSTSLGSELKDALAENRLGHLETVPVRWPDDPSLRSLEVEYETALAHLGLNQLGKDDSSHIALRKSEKRVLVFEHELVRLRPEPSESPINLDYLGRCLAGWNEALETGRLPLDYLIFSFGFALEPGARPRRASSRRGFFAGVLQSPTATEEDSGARELKLRVTEQLDRWQSDYGWIECLPELGAVTEADIILFLQDQGTNIPPERQRDKAAEIIADTDGRYLSTRAAIEALLEAHWHRRTGTG